MINKFQLPKVRVAIVDSFSENHESLITWLNSQRDIRITRVFHSTIEAWNELEADLPEVILVGLEAPNAQKFCQLARRKVPQVVLVGLIAPGYSNVESFRAHTGVVEIIPRDLPFEDFGKALRRSFQYLWEKSFSYIFGVSGVKAGVGATFLASLFGIVLGSQHPGLVLLIDLHESRGDLAFLLNADPSKYLGNLLHQEHFLIPEVFLHYVSPTRFGCGVIPSSQELHPEAIDELSLSALLTGLGNFFKFIILDLPPYPFQKLQSIADLCDHLFFMAGDTLNQIKRTYQVYGDLQRLPKSFLNRITIVTRHPPLISHSDLSKLHSRIKLLPQSPRPILYQTDESPLDIPECRPLIEVMEELLRPFGVLPKTPPPPSLIRYLKSLFGWQKA